MKRLSIIICCFLLLGCSPSKRLSKLLVNHPGLMVTDTVTVIDTFTVNGFRIDTFVRMDTSSAALDSVIKDIKGFSYSIVPEAVLAKVRRLYRYKRVLQDTARYLIDSVDIKLWQEGDKLKITVSRKDIKIRREVKAPCPELVYQPSWWQKGLMWSGGIFWIAIIIGLLYRKIFGKDTA